MAFCQKAKLKLWYNNKWIKPTRVFHHGKWLEIDDGVLIGTGTHVECSRCGTWSRDKQRTNFCSYGGARMDGRDNVPREVK